MDTKTKFIFFTSLVIIIGFIIGYIVTFNTYFYKYYHSEHSMVFLIAPLPYVFGVLFIISVYLRKMGGMLGKAPLVVVLVFLPFIIGDIVTNNVLMAFMAETSEECEREFYRVIPAKFGELGNCYNDAAMESGNEKMCFSIRKRFALYTTGSGLWPEIPYNRDRCFTKLASMKNDQSICDFVSFENDHECMASISIIE